MIHLLFPLYCLFSLFSGHPSVAVEGKLVDYRYAQSAVRNLPIGPQSPAYAVCDMMETFTGVPMRLDAEALRALEAQRGEAGSLALYYQFLLERRGLLRQDSEMDSTNQDEFTHYLCPAGSVLSFAESSKISSPGKIVSFLNEGIRGIVVTYAYCPKEWKKSKGNLQLKQKKHHPKGQHTVLIVGYQDSSFIFKNVWGPEWGEGGYGRMSFSYHYNHAREGLVAYLAEAKPPQSIGTCSTTIKLQPELLDGKPYLQASLVAFGKGKLPDFEMMEYLVSAKSDSSYSKKVLFMENAKSNGYPCLLPIPDYKAKVQIRVQWKLKGMEQPTISVPSSPEGYGWEIGEFGLGK
jgi:hypothetical protein